MGCGLKVSVAVAGVAAHFPLGGSSLLSVHPAVPLLACCQSLARSPEGTAQFPLLLLGGSAA